MFDALFFPFTGRPSLEGANASIHWNLAVRGFCERGAQRPGTESALGSRADYAKGCTGNPAFLGTSPPIVTHVQHIYLQHIMDGTFNY
jgi:hypothetical protein